MPSFLTQAAETLGMAAAETSFSWMSRTRCQPAMPDGASNHANSPDESLRLPDPLPTSRIEFAVIALNNERA